MQEEEEEDNDVTSKLRVKDIFVLSPAFVCPIYYYGYYYNSYYL